MVIIDKAARLKELGGLFLKLSISSFGGPAAHIAMMEEEFVSKRKWLTHSQFLDLVSATNLIPGPNSTELALHIGHLRAGWQGLIVAGLCFILPASLIALACAWFYVRYGQLPQVMTVFHWIKPVIIAIVLQSIWKLGKSAVKAKADLVLVILATVIAFFGVSELLVLFGMGFLSAGLKARQSRSLNEAGSGLVMLAVAGASPTILVSNGGIFLTFLKIGSVLYGSGYVLLAFLRGDFVERLKWLTEAQLLDAVAIGQITPGPLFTTATFIGYLLLGSSGALVATVGIFLPAFILVSISSLIVPRLRKSKSVGYFLDGLNLASLAFMLTVSWQLARSVLVDVGTIAIALLSLLLLVRYQANSLLLIVVASICGVMAAVL